MYLTDDELIELVTDRIRSKSSGIGEIDSILADIERLNIKLAKSEEHRSRFLSIVRNSFHNPLFGMITLVDSIKREVSEDNSIYEKVNLLNLELQSLSYQINNVVSASEIEASQLEMNLSNFSLKMLLKDVNDSLQFLKDRTGCSVEISNEIDEIVQDREKLQVILTNLLSNAISLNSNKMEAILIKVFSDENLIIIDIINSGEVVLSRDSLFSAFKESEGGHYNRESQGLGIGLSIVKSYMEFLGAEISYTVDDGHTRFRAIIDNLETKEDTESVSFDFDFDFDEEEFDEDGTTI